MTEQEIWDELELPDNSDLTLAETIKLVDALNK